MGDGHGDAADPVCPLFGRCGGCQLQNVSYGGQLRWKREKICSLLTALPGNLPPVAPVIPSPLVYGYRTKLTPHHGRIRGSGDEPIGFRSVGDGSLVDVPHCPIACPAINAALPRCREIIRSTPTRRGGTALLRQTAHGVVTDPRELADETVGGRMFYFRAGEFFQNNSSILSAFVAYVVGQARGEGVQFLADVYCGVGLFAISAQGHFAGVEGIEICGEAVRLARLNASIGGVTGVNFSIGEAERIFSFFPYPADRSAVILDPPRRGCGTAFLRQLSAFAPRRIVYVSCCPESQANDLRPLLRDYSIAAIQPIDLFPQTRHIENVVTLEKNIAGGR